MQLVVKNIVPTAAEMKALESGKEPEISRPVDDPTELRGSENSFGNGDVHIRIDSLEDKIVKLSDDLNLFKSFVLKTLETVDRSIKELAQRLDDIPQKTSVSKYNLILRFIAL